MKKFIKNAIRRKNAAILSKANLFIVVTIGGNHEYYNDNISDYNGRYTDERYGRVIKIM